MKPIVLVPVSLLLATSAPAADPQFRIPPGLYEEKVLHMTIDGREVPDPLVQLQEAMAKLPPQQRAAMEASSKANPMVRLAPDGGAEICVSPAMASRYHSYPTGAGDCTSDHEVREGNVARYEFHCNNSGHTVSGKGTSRFDGNVTMVLLETSGQDAAGKQHASRRESKMTFLGSDCQGLVPAHGVGDGTTAH